MILIQLINIPEEDFPNDPYQPPEEEDYGTTNNEPTLESLQQIREENPEGTEIYDNLSLSNSTSDESIVDDISGYWLLSDNQGNTSTIVFNQYNGDFEFVEYNVFNVEIGGGSGSISGNQLSADYYNSLVQINGKLKLTTSTNGQSWSGTVSFPSLGTSTNIAIQRINP